MGTSHIDKKWSEKAKKDSMILDLRMAKMCNETNIKDCLKRWARSVASSFKWYPILFISSSEKNILGDTL